MSYHEERDDELLFVSNFTLFEWLARSVTSILCILGSFYFIVEFLIRYIIAEVTSGGSILVILAALIIFGIPSLLFLIIGLFFAAGQIYYREAIILSPEGIIVKTYDRKRVKATFSPSDLEKIDLEYNIFFIEKGKVFEACFIFHHNERGKAAQSLNVDHHLKSNNAKRSTLYLTERIFTHCQKFYGDVPIDLRLKMGFKTVGGPPQPELLNSSEKIENYYNAHVNTIVLNYIIDVLESACWSKCFIRLNAREQMIKLNISLEEVIRSVKTGKIVENHSKSSYLSTHLITGVIRTQQPLNSLWAINIRPAINADSQGSVYLLDVYEPEKEY
ncbi:MAG: DUF4258 domain-containing protein [Candidatus Odinarchaeota archaeon]